MLFPYQVIDRQTEKQVLDNIEYVGQVPVVDQELMVHLVGIYINEEGAGQVNEQPGNHPELILVVNEKVTRIVHLFIQEPEAVQDDQYGFDADAHRIDLVRRHEREVADGKEHKGDAHADDQFPESGTRYAQVKEGGEDQVFEERKQVIEYIFILLVQVVIVDVVTDE